MVQILHLFTDSVFDPEQPWSSQISSAGIWGEVAAKVAYSSAVTLVNWFSPGFGYWEAGAQSAGEAFAFMH